jgi:hypothetical protein
MMNVGLMFLIVLSLMYLLVFPISLIHKASVEMCLISQLSIIDHSIMVLTTVSFLDLHLHTVVVLYMAPTLLFPLSSSLFCVFFVLLCTHWFMSTPIFLHCAHFLLYILTLVVLLYIFTFVWYYADFWYQIYWNSFLHIFCMFFIYLSHSPHHHHGPCQETSLRWRQG